MGQAQAAFPEKPLNVSVAYAPGGTGDISVRMLAKKLESILGQPLVITNKGGGAGVLSRPLAGQSNLALFLYS